jgi:molecular chaperone GrpE
MMEGVPLPRAGTEDASRPVRRLADLEQEADTERQGRLRVLADFANYRRRTEREAGAARRAGQRDVLLPLVETLDNLERALTAGTSDTEFLRGIQAIAAQIHRALAGLGVVQVPDMGTPFDPQVHEAAGAVLAPGQPPGTVVAVLQKGYRVEDELLRPARVLVARADHPAEDLPSGPSWTRANSKSPGETNGG